MRMQMMAFFNIIGHHADIFAIFEDSIAFGHILQGNFMANRGRLL